jgi:hypothetical protein
MPLQEFIRICNETACDAVLSLPDDMADGEARASAVAARSLLDAHLRLTFEHRGRRVTW